MLNINISGPIKNKYFIWVPIPNNFLRIPRVFINIYIINRLIYKCTNYKRFGHLESFVLKNWKGINAKGFVGTLSSSKIQQLLMELCKVNSIPSSIQYLRSLWSKNNWWYWISTVMNKASVVENISTVMILSD